MNIAIYFFVILAETDVTRSATSFPTLKILKRVGWGLTRRQYTYHDGINWWLKSGSHLPKKFVLFASMKAL